MFVGLLGCSLPRRGRLRSQTFALRCRGSSSRGERGLCQTNCSSSAIRAKVRLPVHDRQDKPTEKTEIPHKTHVLLDSRGLVGLLPKAVAGICGWNDRTNQGKSSEPAKRPHGQSRPAPTWMKPLTRTSVSGSEGMSSVLAEEFTHHFGLLGLARKMANCIDTSDYEDRRKERTGNTPGHWHEARSTSIRKLRKRRERALGLGCGWRESETVRNPRSAWDPSVCVALFGVSSARGSVRVNYLFRVVFVDCERCFYGSTPKSQGAHFEPT